MTSSQSPRLLPQRNDYCFCGSGKKFKKCCLEKYQKADTHNFLGKSLQEKNQLSSAIEHYEQALTLNPAHTDALYNLGVALFIQGKHDESATTLLKLLEFIPDHADAICHLGMSAHCLGDSDNGIDLICNAIAIDPEKPIYYIKLSAILKDQGNFIQQIDCLKKAATYPTPHLAQMYFDIGEAYLKLSDFDLMAEYSRKATEIEPDFVLAHFNLAYAYHISGHPEQSIASYRDVIKLTPDAHGTHSDMLYTMQLHQNFGEAELFKEHRNYAKVFEEPLKATWLPHSNLRAPNKKLRIGYVSADFWDHSVAVFFLPILKNQDKENFESYCYYNNTILDDVNKQIQANADHWIPCKHLSDNDLAEKIRQDEIDILVDLSGHTADNRLLVFARKPAPIQVTWIGYAGTTGLDAMDYRITDLYLDPPEIADKFYSEQLLRLSASAAFEATSNTPEVNSLPALTGTPFTFACLNSHYKFTEDNFELWSKILKQIPNSRMMLGNAGDEYAKNRLTEAFSRYGIDESRLMLMPRISTQEYLALHHQIDLALDPYPYNGGTSTIQSLRMGVPVITMVGMRAVSRCGVALMSGVGLTEFVANTPEEYLAIAQKMANDLPALNAIRLSLRSRWLASSYGNALQYTRELEATYRAIWLKWISN